MATAKDTDQDEVSRITADDVIVPPGSEHDVIRHGPRNIGHPVPAYQGICNVTVNKEFIQTPALDEAYDILQRTGWVILCGPPGSGKTKLAYALSRRSRDQDPRHFSPYVLEHLEQLKPEVGQSEYSVVIVDGTLGKVRIKNQQYDCWELVLDTIVKLREEGTCRFVITVYPHVLRELQQLETDGESPLLDDSAVIWLTDALPEDVKVQLLDFHLDKLPLETARRRQVVEEILKKDISGPVFPRCCDNMVKHWDVSSDPTAIFVAPAEVHTGLFKRMVLHHTHGDVFAALFSLTMKGMSQFLHDPLKTEIHLQELGLHPYSPDKLAAYADVLLGSILSQGTFSSRVLYEAAGLALGRYFRLPVLVAVCDTPFLVQYVDIMINHGIPEDQRANMCVAVGSVPCCSNDPKQCAEDFQALVKRTYAEIVQGNLQLICQHPCLQHPQFLQELVNHCAGNGKMIKQLLNARDPEYQLPLGYWSAFLPSHHLTHWCLLKMQADRKLSTRVWMAWSLVDNTTQSSEQSLQSILRETVTARHFEYSEYTMEFPFLGKDQCLTKEMQKQIEILKETGSTQGRLLYLLDPSLPIPPEIVMLQMTHGKLKLQVQDRRHWYLVFRLLTDREVNETDSDGNSLLHVAVSCGQFTAVRLCLKAGAVITQQNRKGVTPYQMKKRNWSLFSKTRETASTDQIFRRFPDMDVAEVQLLLLQELSVEDRDSDGGTGLLVACREGRGDIADLYIDLGADINVKDTFGVYLVPHGFCIRPLHHACRNGLVSTVQRLIQCRADVTIFADGLTALHFAFLCPLRSAAADITRLLVQEMGADINTQLTPDDPLLSLFSLTECSGAFEVSIGHDAFVSTQGELGNTLLHLAAFKGHSDTADLLLCHGANVSSQDGHGNTSLHLAAYKGLSDTAALLIRHNADVNTQNESGCTPLHCAAQEGHSDTAELLIGHHANITTRDGEGWTALYWAALKGNLHTAKLLIRYGSEVTVQGKEGFTPLHGTAQERQSDTAELLIAHGAGVNTQTEKGWTPLHSAAFHGQSDIAEVLIRHSAGINMASQNGGTPLHLAAFNGHPDTTELLIGHGADVNAQTDMGNTALHHAAFKGQSRTAEVLICHDADVNTHNKVGSTPLHCAGQNGHTVTAELLIERGANLKTQSDLGNTPLHLAVREGHTDTAQLLIRHGARVIRYNRKGFTPLHYAAQKGHSDMAELLMHCGANVNTQSYQDSTPVHLAASNGHAHTAELLIQHGADVDMQNRAGFTPLHCCAQEGRSNTTELLIAHGADVNLQSTEGDTPLHHAALTGHSSTAGMLMRFGANANTRNNKGSTPLHSAAGHCHTAELLVQHGADVHAQNTVRFTPLHYAALEGCLEATELLLDHGAEVNVQSTDGDTPLHCAAIKGHSQAAGMLMCFGADVNTQNKGGRTQLHFAAEDQRSDTAEMLIRHGADVNTQDKNGRTPLHCATCKGRSDAVELLIRHDADVSIRNVDGWSPLHCAAFYGHTVIVELLIRHRADVNAQDEQLIDSIDCLGRSVRYSSTADTSWC